MSKIIGFLPDALILTGAGVVVYGIALIHPAAAYIAGGACVVAIGVILSPES